MDLSRTVSEKKRFQSKKNVGILDTV